ncbi:hypothetical protein [Clostridium perfringens]|uniref:hypothetical protein n=1 Tax=Clostridium perfringens TaxID=1502 RepID=UPI0039ED3673
MREIYVSIYQKNDDCYCDIKDICYSLEEIEKNFFKIKEFFEEEGLEFNLNFDDYLKRYKKLIFKSKRKLTKDIILNELVNLDIIKRISSGSFMGDYFKVNDFSKIYKSYYIF